jgi:hypothetical protein
MNTHYSFPFGHEFPEELGTPIDQFQWVLAYIMFRLEWITRSLECALALDQRIPKGEIAKVGTLGPESPAQILLQSMSSLVQELGQAVALQRRHSRYDGESIPVISVDSLGREALQIQLDRDGRHIHHWQKHTRAGHRLGRQELTRRFELIRCVSNLRVWDLLQPTRWLRQLVISPLRAVSQSPANGALDDAPLI